jgi:UDP-N-acetylmuramoyl-L-alanyl-D-glutamate--2,6-diaminopimelate ligase
MLTDRNSKDNDTEHKSQGGNYGVRTMADFKARFIESHVDGMLLEIDGSQMWSRLIGAFNAYNLLAVYGTARLLGLEKEQVLGTLSSLETVNGRFQNISSETGVTAIIDYAHTPDALENVLGTIRQVRSKESRIITVAGAGGDRDRTKRPEMGAIAAAMSDIFIITSDNPRSEDPDRIILDIKEGIKDTDIKKVLSVADRKEAIKTACMMARSGDIILVAGKGHETYQEIKGVKHHFNDFEVVKEIFKQ